MASSRGKIGRQIIADIIGITDNPACSNKLNEP